MFSSHGSDIYEHEGFFRVMVGIPPELAWNMLKFSVAVPEYPAEKYPGDEAFLTNQGLLNKTWAIVGESARYLIALCNYDGTYSLHCISKPDFALIVSRHSQNTKAWELLRSYWL